MSGIMEITKENFQQEVMECDIPVVVDFYTDHCVPCIALAQVLDELSETYAGKIHMTKFHVSTDEVLANSNEVMNTYDVMGFPTVLILKDGKVLNSLLGGQTKATLVEAFEAI